MFSLDTARMWTFVGLVVALLGPPVFAVLSSEALGAAPGLGIQVALQVLYVGMAAFVVWIVVRRERCSLSSIGLRRPTLATVAAGLLLAGVTLYVLPVMTDPLALALGANVEPGIDELVTMPLWFRAALGATGGAIEELLYRGYAIERLTTVIGRRWVAGSASLIAFTLAHVPMWGIGFALAAVLPFGIVMTVVYLWRRDLAANALGHSVGLVVAMGSLGAAV
jgi:membrane protease YdiL (CAAX protease family)